MFVATVFEVGPCISLDPFPPTNKAQFWYLHVDFVIRSSVYLSKLEVCVVWNVEVIKVSKSLVVAFWTTKHSSTRLDIFMMVAKHTFYTYMLHLHVHVWLSEQLFFPEKEVKNSIFIKRVN